jgi:hypothetical protein
MPDALPKHGEPLWAMLLLAPLRVNHCFRLRHQIASPAIRWVGFSPGKL